MNIKKIILALAVLFMFTGCAQNNTEKIDIIEETYKTDVTDKSPETNENYLIDKENENLDKPIIKNENISNNINNITKQMLVYEDNQYSSKIVSGYSAYSILTKVLPYASGETENQIKCVLGNIGIEDFTNQTTPYLKQSNRKENKNNEDDFIIESSISDYILETSDLFLVDDSCKLNTEPTSDFVFKDLQDESIVPYVNDYVSEKTHKLINSLINEPFSKQSLLTIIDTIYFKGQWQNQFMEELTEKDIFYGKTKESEVDMMEQANYFAQYENMIRLPYNSNSQYHIVMDIVKDIDDVEAAFDYYNENKHQLEVEANNQKKVHLSMPKFKNEVTMTLNDVYKSLGITDLFDISSCDLTKLADNLFVSDAIQKAKIIVDENGTEAAAVTMMIMKTTSLEKPEQPEEFKVNKPFIYVIKVQETDDILFAGYYYDF